MHFSEYQILASKTAIYPGRGDNFIYPTLGLCGESGEVAEKIKKVLRDNGGVLTEEIKQQLAKELGDILWYHATLCNELGLNMDAVASGNIEKLQKRQQENKLHGSGDNR